MTLKFYILKDRQAVPATMEEWSRFLTSEDRTVGVWTFAEGSVTVSTVFLGLDPHARGDRPPLLFETMVFGGAFDRHQERTATWAEAELMHESMCAMVRTRVLQ